MTKERVQAIMTEIGPLLELTEVARLDDDAVARWTVVVEEDVLVLLTYDADWDRLTFAAELLTPPVDRQAEIYADMLLYNSQWAATGGVRVALAERDGALIQLFDVPVEKLDTQGFGAVLLGFVEKVRGWREALASRPAGSDAATAEAGIDKIRV